MTKMTKKEGVDPGDELPLLSGRILSLIFDKRYEDARSLINQEQKRFSAGEAHRFMALAAVLHEYLGEIDEAIALMRKAVLESPTWISHLYQLSVLLMDAKRWDDADLALSKLIALSLAQNEVYFISEARFRRAMCLKKLGRLTEFQQMNAEIPMGTRVFIGDKSCRIEDVT